MFKPTLSQNFHPCYIYLKNTYIYLLYKCLSVVGHLHNTVSTYLGHPSTYIKFFFKQQLWPSYLIGRLLKWVVNQNPFKSGQSQKCEYRNLSNVLAIHCMHSVLTNLFSKGSHDMNLPTTFIDRPPTCESSSCSPNRPSHLQHPLQTQAAPSFG